MRAATERFDLLDNAALGVEEDERPGYRGPYAKPAGRIGAKHVAASVVLPSSGLASQTTGRNRRAELASDDFSSDPEPANVYSL